MTDKLVLVNLDDEETGYEEKLAVHERGLLHRAFSVFLFNGDWLLIQKRAAGKYHSAGLWANTCCSHPREGENLMEAACLRLMTECGIGNVELTEAGSFLYRSTFANGLTEYELDHVFVGSFDGEPVPNPEEIEEMKWISLADLKADMKDHPERYAVWFFTALGIAEGKVR